MSDEVMGLVQAPLKHAGDILSAWGHDPERAVLGINNPAESAVWGSLLGKDYSPDVNMLGGATEAQKADMAASGINMGLAKPAYAIADTVASIMGSQGAAGGLGAAFGGAAGATGGTLGEGVAAGAEGAEFQGAVNAGATGAAETGAAGATAKTVTGSAIGDAALKSGATTAAQAVVAKAMAPKAPTAASPIEMPDPLAVEQARKQSMLDQIARRGRASTIMTGTGSRKGLGG